MSAEENKDKTKGSNSGESGSTTSTATEAKMTAVEYCESKNIRESGKFVAKSVFGDSQKTEKEWETAFAGGEIVDFKNPASYTNEDQMRKKFEIEFRKKQ